MLTPHTTGKAQFNPSAKTFRQRLGAWLDDAKSSYGLSVRQDSGRNPDWQQRLHICHMFLYNKYQSTKPAKTEAGKRTISWTHISNPKVAWATVPLTDILRTRTYGIPAKDNLGWKKGFEPERSATEKRAKDLLASAGIGNGGQAMVSSGSRSCGEPCKCSAGRSKHLDGMAADLNTADMNALTKKLTAAKGGTIDEYLKGFGLHRPLLNHWQSPEPWHIEATRP